MNEEDDVFVGEVTSEDLASEVARLEAEFPAIVDVKTKCCMNFCHNDELTDQEKKAANKRRWLLPSEEW